MGPYEIDLDNDEHAAIVEALSCAATVGVPIHVTVDGATYTYTYDQN